MTNSKEDWRRKVAISGQKTVEADARIVDAFKNIGYSMEAAIADLVDNSIDARSTTVRIRFIRTTNEIISLAVVDNGRGMSEDVIDQAMEFGGKRRYKEGDLGMYGMGLKSASLSQADEVTVVSRSRGCDAVGRRSSTRLVRLSMLLYPTYPFEEAEPDWPKIPAIGMAILPPPNSHPRRLAWGVKDAKHPDEPIVPVTS